MPGARITVDGLWRCLCPSADGITLARAIGVPYRPRFPNTKRSRRSPCAARSRPLHTTRRRLKEDKPAKPAGISAFIDAEKKMQHGGSPRTDQDAGATDSKPVDAQPGEQPEIVPEPQVIEGPAVESAYVEAGLWTKDGANTDESHHETTTPYNAAAVGAQGRISLGTSVIEERSEAVPTAASWTPTALKTALQENDTQRSKEDEAETAYLRALPRMPKRLVNTSVERILRMKAPFTELPPNTTEQDIYDAIRCIMFFGDTRWRWLTTVLVKWLLDNGAQPNNFIYSAVIASHALTEGSADTVRDLLNEMRTHKIPWSSTSYHCALRALANHPNYLLRNDVIREMRERWIETTDSGHGYILIGLLRDGQYEIALTKLDELTAKGVEIRPFVYDIFIYVLGKLQFFDDALRIARHQRDRGVNVSVNVWYFLLDVGSKGQNHRVTRYLWNRTVEQGLVNPSDGVLLNILNLAAAYGDTQLAIQVIQYLSARGAKLSRHHYEALAEAYIMHEQVDKAMEVYCIMDAAGIEVNGQTTGQLSQSLSMGDAALIDAAVQALSDLKQKYKLPIGVFNSVLLALVEPRASTGGTAAGRTVGEGAVEALDLYRRIRHYVPSGPDLETYKILLWQCTDADVAQFLAGEMIALHFRQTPAIREMVFKIHIEHNGPTHRTKRYFYQMARQLMQEYAPGSRKWNVLMDLCMKLVKRLVRERDPEAWHILDICKAYGLDDERIERLRQDIESGRIDVVDDAESAENAFSTVDQTPELGESPEDILWPKESYSPMEGRHTDNNQPADSHFLDHSQIPQPPDEDQPTLDNRPSTDGKSASNKASTTI